MKPNKLRGSLSLRLTIWYAGIFTLTSMVILFVFYFRISAVTMENTNDELIEEYVEYIDLMNSEGRGGVISEFEQEIVEEAEENIFLRLISMDGRVIRSSDMTPFGMVGIHTESLKALKKW